MIALLRHPRASRWAAEATAWSAALVLFAGVAVVASGVISTSTTAASTQAFTPTVTTVTTRTVPPPSPVARAVPKVEPRASRATIPLEDSLGPPPGPQVDQVPARTAPPDKRYALLVGVTNYRAPTHDTVGGANDVRFLYASLLAAGWPPGNVRVLTDGEATGDAVRAGLAWLASQSVTGTFAMFHWSGHVKQAGGHEKLWPVDRDFVPDDQVTSLLSRSSGKMWVDIAGCESGGFLPGLPSTRVLVTTSSRVTQKSYEYPQWGQSVWAGLVYDLGLSQGSADADRDGRTTIGEALRYATYYAQAITLRQTPYGRQTPQVQGDPVRGWTLSDPPA